MYEKNVFYNYVHISSFSTLHFFIFSFFVDFFLLIFDYFFSIFNIFLDFQYFSQFLTFFLIFDMVLHEIFLFFSILTNAETCQNGENLPVRTLSLIHI